MGSGAAAFAVLVAVLLGWWLFSGNGPQGPPGSASRMSTPDDAAAATDAPTPVLRTVPGGVRLVEFREVSGGLELTYADAEAATCGPLGTPRVQESDVAVTVLLLRETPADAPASCSSAPAASTGTATVFVDLDGPVGDRSILDASYADRRVRVPPAE